ncbi:hypothetical protein [Ammoniphilus sp. 3BR4]|uniref:hypothetical protein n=1 Tax=Ammoniphilus sp. 3BR4 TaxID=3158265 RepID=UPI003465DF5C
MIDYIVQPRQRFVAMPSEMNEQKYVVYDSLLEQSIGYSHTSLQPCMEMASHLNRLVPNFE